MAGYTVKYGQQLLYEAGNEERMIHDAQLGLRTDGVSTFTFVMTPSHIMRDHIKLRDLEVSIQVYFDDQILFSGFAVSAAETFNKELAVSCVSDLQLLKDVHMRIEDHPKDNGIRRLYRANELFIKCLRAYNDIVSAQYDGAREFLNGHNLNNDDVGYMDEKSDPSDPEHVRYVVDANASTPTPILDVLTKSIVEPYGCLLRTWRRASDNKRALGIYLDAWETSSQVIRFGENLTKYAKVMSTEDMYTGCLPIGGTWREYDVTYAEWVRTTQVCPANTNYFWVRSIAGDTIHAKKGDLIHMGDGNHQFAEDIDIPTYGGVQVKIEGVHQDSVDSGVDGYWFDRKTKYVNKALTLGRLPDAFYNENGDALQESDPNAKFRKVGEVLYFRRTNQSSDDGVVGYGIKTFTFTDSDVMTAKGLFRRAVSLLLPKVQPTVTLEVSGVDMALYMENYRHLTVGQKVRVISEPHNVDMTMQVTQATLSLDNPSATTYVIGPAPTTATQRITKTRQAVDDVRDIITYDINDVITGSEILRLQ